MASQKTDDIQAEVRPAQSMTIFGSFEGTCDSTSQYMRAKKPRTSTASTARLVGLVSFPRGDDISKSEGDLAGLVHGIFVFLVGGFSPEALRSLLSN